MKAPLPTGVTECTRTVRVTNALGLYARTARILARTAAAFKSDILVSRNVHAVDAKSLIGLLLLQADKGERLRLYAKGPDAAEAVNAVEGLFLRGFDEE